MLAIRQERKAVVALLAVVVAMLVAALTIEVDVAVAAAATTTTTKKGRKANLAHLELCNRPKSVDAYNCTMSL